MRRVAADSDDVVLAAEIGAAEAERLQQCLCPIVRRVRLATSAQQVLERLREETFQRAVVATELVLGGQPILARLAVLPAIRCLVAVGPGGDGEMERRARGAGACAYVVRPVSSETLARALTGRGGGAGERNLSGRNPENGPVGWNQVPS